MDRREMLKCLTAGAAGAPLSLLFGNATPLAARLPQAQVDRPNGLPPLKITDVKTIITAPNGIRLVVVKVSTSEPGLYGLGCATYNQRPLVVKTAVYEYLKPFLIGRDPANIEDIWQTSFVSSYWRNGPVLNNAMSGVDMALWDINGKRAGMPVYQLLGGKCRFAVDTYAHASGNDLVQVEDQVRALMEQGFRHVRAQVSTPGYDGYGARGAARERVQFGHPDDRIFEPRPYSQIVVQLFEHLRNKLGFDVELLHDIHERVPPLMAIEIAKRLEPCRLFFLEDPFPPEQNGYFRMLRQQTATPIAMGELFNNAHEWVGLISERLIDFIRVHLSQVGGLTVGRKIAALAEWFDVRTAWHGPGDVSPVGHLANIALDLACYNFGIQERTVFGAETQEVFPGSHRIENGYLYANEAPGFGIDINEQLAARYPVPAPGDTYGGLWLPYRKRDGTVVRP